MALAKKNISWSGDSLGLCGTVKIWTAGHAQRKDVTAAAVFRLLPCVLHYGKVHKGIAQMVVDERNESESGKDWFSEAESINFDGKKDNDIDIHIS